MARKIQVKLIMQLRAAGLSQSEIARTQHMSKSSVSEVFSIAKERQISYEALKDKSVSACYQLFYPDRNQEEQVYEQPDYAYVQRELARTGVTLKLLWKEYQDRGQLRGKLCYGYTRFCNGYSEYVVSQNLTNRLEHKPGTTSQVDWSGSTMQLTNPATGERRKVYLFVAALPYSQFTYVEPCLDMKENTWLLCNVHMFEYWGGTTTRIVCDNLKTGVVNHPKEGEIVLNEAYEALGNYYMTAIMPAQVRKPKQKAAVEGAVGKIATAVIARLRNDVFHSMDELTRFHSPRYRHLSAILSAEEDISFQQQKAQEQRESEQAEQGYLRGAAYYGGLKHD